jgi:hypothetical protein
MSLPLLVSLFVAIKWLRNKDGEDEKTQSESTQSGTGQENVV